MPDRIGDAHAACFRRFIESLWECADLVIVDNTSIRATEIAPYVLGAQAFGYDATILQFTCSPEVSAVRNVHGVPRETIDRMWTHFYAEFLPPHWIMRQAETFDIKSLFV